MAAEKTAVPNKTLLARIGRGLLYGGATLVVIIFLANYFWKRSGSGEWELEIDRDGVQIYSMKLPGSYLKQFRGVMRAEYTLNQLVAGLIENATLENCLNHIPSCVDLKVISPWNERTLSDTVLWKLEMPAPFLPRESLIRSQVSQDPVTKVVVVDIIASPNSIPLNPGAVRLKHIQNRWKYTPLGSGEVEIEFTQDIDMGGMFPDFLMNLAGAEETYKFLHDQLPGLIEKESLKKIKYDFIEEADDNLLTNH